MPRGRPKKLPFEDLDQNFKDEVANLTDEQVKQKLAAIAIAEHENREAKKQDQDLESKHIIYRDAGEQYREATKNNRLRTEFCYDILASRGKV